MMRRLLAGMLCAACTVALAGCGGKTGRAAGTGQTDMTDVVTGSQGTAKRTADAVAGGQGTAERTADAVAASQGTADAMSRGQGTAAGAGSGVVELTVWAEEANYELLGRMIDSFTAEYAGEAEFEITLVQASESEAKNLLLADVHGGADVFAFADDQLLQMVAAGALDPVRNAGAVRAANLPEAVEAASYRDTLYAYPMTADNGYFMYYNKAYFAKEDIATLDGMLAVADAAEKQISMEWDSGWYLYAFFGNTGLECGINDDNVTNHCDWNSTQGPIRGVDVAEAMLAIAAHPGFSNRTDSEFVEGVRDGSVIAGVSGVWNSVEIRDAWGENYSAVKLPTYTVAGRQVQMASFNGYKMAGVNAYSQEPEWAHRFADWITNEENQDLRFQERRQGPSNQNAAASEEVTADPALQAMITQGQYGDLQRVGTKYWEATTEFGLAMAAGNPEGADLQELMDVLVEGITGSVAD